MHKLIAEKVKKGYVERSSGPNANVSAPAASVALPKPAKNVCVFPQPASIAGVT
jgi:predicted DNA-binding WGR domain protein